jgi:hypothetical protein
MNLKLEHKPTNQFSILDQRAPWPNSNRAIIVDKLLASQQLINKHSLENMHMERGKVFEGDNSLSPY